MEDIKLYKSYILDRESYDEKYSGQNELIVAHWKPLSIVMPKDLWAMLGPKMAKENTGTCDSK